MTTVRVRLVRLEDVEARRTAEGLAAEYGVAVESALGCVRWVAAFRRANGRLPTLGEVAREVAADCGVDEAVALAELDRLVEEGLR